MQNNIKFISFMNYRSTENFLGECNHKEKNNHAIQRAASFQEIISLENLFLAWKEFKKGKKNKKDVQLFELNLEDNLFQLYEDLKNQTYQHSNYIDIPFQNRTEYGIIFG